MPRRMRSRSDGSRQPDVRPAGRRAATPPSPQTHPLSIAGGEVLFLPDRHLGLEGVDQVRARGAAPPADERHRQPPLRQGHRPRGVRCGARPRSIRHRAAQRPRRAASVQHLGSAGVLGVVERGDVCTMVAITHGSRRTAQCHRPLGLTPGGLPDRHQAATSLMPNRREPRLTPPMAHSTSSTHFCPSPPGSRAADRLRTGPLRR